MMRFLRKSRSWLRNFFSFIYEKVKIYYPIIIIIIIGLTSIIIGLIGISDFVVSSSLDIINSSFSMISNFTDNKTISAIISIIIGIISGVTMMAIIGSILGNVIRGIVDNFGNILLTFNRLNKLINNQVKKINHRFNLRYFFKSIILCLLPSECQEHFKDQAKNILKENKKYIAYYKIIKLYFWEMLLMRIINSCYLRIKNVIFRSFIK